MSLNEDDITRAIALGLKIAERQLCDIAAEVPGKPQVAAAGMVCCGIVGLMSCATNAGMDRDSAIAEAGEIIQRLFLTTLESTRRIMSPAGDLR